MLNETLAYGQPTNQVSEDAQSMMDLAMLPTNQTHLWNKMSTGEAETNPMPHNSVIIKTVVPITTEMAATECHYTMNYDFPEQYCLRKFLTNITLPIFKAIIEQMTDYLNAKDIDTKPHEIILPLTQEIHYALHSITALQIFGIKKVHHSNRNQNRKWENHEEIQGILHD